MGGDTLHQEKPWGFTTPGIKADHRESTSATSRWNLTVPPAGGGDARGGVVGTEKYIYIRHNTVENYIETRPILELCLEMERCSIYQVARG